MHKLDNQGAEAYLDYMGTHPENNGPIVSVSGKHPVCNFLKVLSGKGYRECVKKTFKRTSFSVGFTEVLDGYLAGPFFQGDGFNLFEIRFM